LELPRFVRDVGMSGVADVTWMPPQE